MKIQEQIKVIKEMIEGLEELNGEFQDGWQPVISKGKEMLKHLEDVIKP